MNKEIQIIMWFIHNIKQFIEYDRTDLIDVVEGVGEHPHYRSREIISIVNDGEDIVERTACSGSPSCWDTYYDYLDYVWLAEHITYLFNQYSEKADCGVWVNPGIREILEGE